MWRRVVRFRRTNSGCHPNELSTSVLERGKPELFGETGQTRRQHAYGAHPRRATRRLRSRDRLPTSSALRGLARTGADLAVIRMSQRVLVTTHGDQPSDAASAASRPLDDAAPSVFGSPVKHTRAPAPGWPRCVACERRLDRIVDDRHSQRLFDRAQPANRLHGHGHPRARTQLVGHRLPAARCHGVPGHRRRPLRAPARSPRRGG